MSIHKTHFRGFLFLFPVLFCVVFFACDRLEIQDDLNDLEIELVDHRGNDVIFPEAFKGKALLVGYVYTNCPDVCPLVTYNMRDVERELDREDIYFLSISFDPARDTPEILAEYAENYSLDEKKWSLLTGNSRSVNQLLDRLGIATLKSPTRFTDSGREIYFIDHTDRITLVDKEGNVRRHYRGSELRSEEVVGDLRTLLDSF